MYQFSSLRAHDQQTLLELAEEYFASIVAPHKEFVRFDGCHHFVVMNRPDAFSCELLARVRPLLQWAANAAGFPLL
jgi:pimeloyl-ACP methyl ester carboxylesterase